MFKPLRIVYVDDLKSKELPDFLDSRFHPELYNNRNNEQRSDEKQAQKYWREDFLSNLPKSDHELLSYITQSSTSYAIQNFAGRMCFKYVWKEFFKAFPRGCIMIVDLPRAWFDNVWRSQFDLTQSLGLDPKDFVPQGMSGILTDNLPLNILALASFGIHSLMLFDYIHTSSDLVFIYIPDRAIEHQQMLDSGAYATILWRFSHIYNDQWTFDGFRGLKSAVKTTDMNPLENLNYLTWFIDRINDRMIDILSISEPLRREQISMTFSRAVCDCVLSITSQLPYMSKVFFFACLDKLCNLYTQIGLSTKEIDAWNTITEPRFLSSHLTKYLQAVPDSVGQFLRTLVDWVVEELEYSKITPQVLRDIRNSHHGYNLYPDIVKRLFTSDGELHNDITMLATPLVLYFLGLAWT